METSKKIDFAVRIAAIAIIVIFFIPTFCVSCEDYMEVEFSAFDAATGNINEKIADELGTEYDKDDPYVNASPILFIIVILAGVIIKFSNTNHKVSIICAASCLIVMPIMKGEVYNFINSEEYARYVFDVKTTFAYALHIILSIAIIVILLFEKYVLQDPVRNDQFNEMRKKYIQGYENVQSYSSDNMRSTKNNIVETNDKVADEPTCSLCGAPLGKGATYCSKCKSEINPVNVKESKSWMCSCGAVNNNNDNYCSVCYKKKN